MRTIWDGVFNGIEGIVCAEKNADGFIGKRIFEIQAIGRRNSFVEKSESKADGLGMVPNRLARCSR